jgi:hypothetical protein
VQVARIVVVHGINNTYRGPETMAGEWAPAMLDGVRLADHQGVVTADDVACVFYGDVFRREGRFLGGDDLVELDPLDIHDPAELALVQQWWAAAASTDSAVMPPDTRTLGPAAGVKAALAALAGSRLLAGATERLLILWLNQVRAYFTDGDKRALIQQHFTEAITSDTRVVVAHSLGSVVAYEALCAHPDWPVEALVTLGSPLGIRNVIFDRLDPPPRALGGELRGAWPGGVQRWTNISDRVDFVALVRELHDWFGAEIVDVEISNGVKLHDVTRYLTAAETGRAIVEGLTGAPPRWPRDLHG